MRATGAGRIVAAAAAALFLVASAAGAATLNIRPITLDQSGSSSTTVTGTITMGATPGAITAWNLAVTTVQQLGHFTIANTPLKSVAGVVASATGLTVQTSPDSATTDGGFLGFRSSNPFANVGVTLADFTGANAAGGQAMYMNGAAFDFLSLNQPDASAYQVASKGAGNVFSLQPLSFSGGVSLYGTITTDGTTGTLGPANILSWDIFATQTTVDIFDSSNSTISSGLLGTAANGIDLTALNPGGYLGFSKGALGGRPYSLVLADFTDPTLRGGTAGYFQGRLQTLTIPLGAGRGPWSITGSVPIAAAVPLPAAFPMFASALAIGAALTRRRRKHRSGPL